MLKGSIGKYVKDPHGSMFNLEAKVTPKMDGLGAEYPTILPVVYYKNLIDKERAKTDKDKWFLRPHHIETLTEHPSSLKDNVLDTNYYSFYTELEKDLDGNFLTPEESAARKKPTEKDVLINNLESQIADLKRKLTHTARNSELTSAQQKNSIPVHELKKYYLTDQDANNADPMTLAFESVLDNLRTKERGILNKKRETDLQEYGLPDPSWYTSKDANFTKEMKKFDKMMQKDPQREEKIKRLMSRELY